MSEQGNEKPSRLGLVLAFLAVYIVWGSTYLAIRIALETLPPFFMASARFLVAGAILYVWSRLRGAERPERAHWKSALIVGTLLFLGGNGGVVWAEQSVQSGVAALMIASEPLWIVMLGWAMSGGVRPTGRATLGLVVGFGGVALLVGAGAGAERVDPVGAVVLVLSALSWAAGSLISPRASFPKSQVLSTAMTMLAGGAVLLVAALVNGEASRAFQGMGQFSMRSLLAVGYLTVFGSIVAFSAYRWLLAVTSPSRASTYAYVNPGVAVFLGWAFANEPVGPHTLLAGAVIVLAVVLIVTDEGRARPKREMAQCEDAEKPEFSPAAETAAA